MTADAPRFCARAASGCDAGYCGLMNLSTLEMDQLLSSARRIRESCRAPRVRWWAAACRGFVLTPLLCVVHAVHACFDPPAVCVVRAVHAISRCGRGWFVEFASRRARCDLEEGDPLGKAAERNACVCERRRAAGLF
jgi:hypothetical protein